MFGKNQNLLVPSVATFLICCAVSSSAHHEEASIDYKLLCSECCYGVTDSVANAHWEWWDGGIYAHFRRDETTVNYNFLVCSWDEFDTVEMFNTETGVGEFDGHGWALNCGSEDL